MKSLVRQAALLLLTLFAPLLFAQSSGERVTIQLKWRHQFQFAGYYAAVEKGYYADEGLKVSLRERESSSDSIDEVIAGKAQYGVSDTGLLLARQQGEPVVLLRQIFQHSKDTDG